MTEARVLEHYTYDDYKEWDGDWELIDGVPMSMSPAPIRKHQHISFVIAKELDKHINNCKECEVLQEIDYKVNEDTVLRPDVVLTCNDPSENYLKIAPEIVVEVISPSTARRDEKYKFEIYESEKIKYYILVYPNDLMAKIYRLKESGYSKEGDFTTETYRFDDTICEVSVDFETVFERYLK